MPRAGEQEQKASVLMQGLSHPTETVLSNEITKNRIVLSFKDSPRNPLRRRPCVLVPSFSLSAAICSLLLSFRSARRCFPFSDPPRFLLAICSGHIRRQREERECEKGERLVGRSGGGGKVGETKTLWRTTEPTTNTFSNCDACSRF